MNAQRLHDALVGFARPVDGRPRNRFILAIATIGVRIAARFMGDPIILQNINGSQLFLPMSHALPRILRRHPDYSSNIGRIACAMHRKYRDLSMIDIGANVGDTVAMVYRYTNIPVLCIDGDARYFKLLEKNAVNWIDVEIELAFVSAVSGPINGRLDCRNGSGHFISELGNITQSKTLDEILDRHPRFVSSKLIKIDTDGFDTLIIKAIGSLIDGVKPAIHFEYDPHFLCNNDPNGFEIFNFLRAHGYMDALVFENTGAFREIVDLSDGVRLKGLHAELEGRGGARYIDVCAFHPEDLEVFTTFLADELTRSG